MAGELFDFRLFFWGEWAIYCLKFLILVFTY